MDFMFNGPRLQVNTFEGLESCPTPTRSQNLEYAPGAYHSATSPLPRTTTYPLWNELMLGDQWNGKQKVYKISWPNGTTSYETQGFTCRFALATTTPGYYIIVSRYFYATMTFHYTKIGDYPIEPNTTAKTFTVRLKKSEWGSNQSPGANISSYARNNQGIYTGNVYLNSNWYMDWTNSAANGYVGAQTYISRESNGDYWDQKFEFNTNWAIKVSGTHGIFPCDPIDLAGKKYGTWQDQVHVNPSGETGQVAKVYSRAKGCYCLKSFLNGEIPILNE